MAISATSRPHRRARPTPSIRNIAVLALPVLLGGVLLGSATGHAADATLCGDREALLEQFQLQHEETPRALGLGADGGVIEVLVSPQGGWTMLVTYPDRPTCVVAIGKAWEVTQVTGEST